MVWTKAGDVYRKPCEHCAGTGYLVHSKYSVHHCVDHWEEIDHPANSKYDTSRAPGGIGHMLMLCNVCHRVWVYYVELSDDSWDVPGPECIGTVIPGLDWRVGQPVT